MRKCVFVLFKDKESRIAELQLGADNYHTKPFDPGELMLRARSMPGCLTSTEVALRASEVYRLEVCNHTIDNAITELAAFTRAEFNLLAALLRVHSAGSWMAIL